MIMKKFFNSIFVIIAAMVAFAGCAKEIDTPAAPETKTVQFYAESIETKTAFGTPDGITYPTLWTANDKSVKLSLNYANPKDADVVVSDDFRTATFTAEITDDGTGAYVFYAMSPASAYNSFSGTNKYLSANIPTTQIPLTSSVDENAQVLYAVSDQFDEMPSSVSLNFKHFTAYGKVSFKNLNLGEAVVTSVAISSSVDIAGRWNYMVETDSFVENSGSSGITLTTSSVEDLWFACAPVDMNNQTLTFTVNTTNGPLSKKVTLTNKKFEAGKIATMTVDMTGIEFTESVVYDLVTDPSSLTPDSEIIIVASESDVALSTTQNSNNRGQAGVTKATDKSKISDPGTTVQTITIEDGNIDGTVAFNVGNGYLYAASSSSNHLRTEATLSDNSSWLVTIDGGVATIVAQGANTRNVLQYNSSSSLFSCYGSASQKAVSIYKRQGTGSAPLPKLAVPVVTAELMNDDTGIMVSWEEVENATEYVISGIGDDVTVEGGTSYSFENLAAGTYEIVVTAKAAGYRAARSEVAEVEVPYVSTGESTDVEMTIFATTGTLASDSGSISWTQDDFTVTNVKGGTAIRTSDSDHYRIYANSTLKFTASGKTISRVVVTCTSDSYATVLSESASSASFTASASGKVVTITSATPVSEMAINLTAQTRINKVVATLN